jgi:pyrroloquinoline quinone biosynthesis protein D
MIAGEARPRLAPGVRMHEDRVRGRWVVQAPERMLLPDETALAVLHLVDGERSVDGIVDELATAYGAPREEIAGDVREFVASLVADGVVLA